MAGLFAQFVLLLLLESFSTVSTRKCPCEEPAYCEPMKRSHDKEFLMFSTKTNVWRKYDWSKVTTIALFRPWEDELMCEAHKRGVRVVLSAKFPTSKLSDKELRAKWISNLTQEAVNLFADGINIDIEEEIPKGSPEVALLTELVNETAHAFHSRIPGSQVSFDVAWSPGCTYGRCYDAKALSEVTDFLVIMAYDEQIQRGKKCIAKANSPLNQTAKGVANYLSLGIKREKLVLGLPWYAYDFPCQELQGNVCTIKRFPFEVNSCGPGAHRQISYSKVRDLMVSRLTSGPHWDPGSSSMFFDYEDSVGVTHQVWYDNARSLTLKYKFAANKGLNGVAIWNADVLDYSDLTRAQEDTKKMWDALQH